MKVLKESTYGYLNERADKAAETAKILGVSGLVLLFASLYMIGELVFLAGIIGLIFAALLLLFGLSYLGFSRRWKLGAQGEQMVTRELLQLDDTFMLLNDMKLPGSRGNIDHIVTGPNGVVVVETKNYGGGVVCRGDDWSRGRKTEKQIPRRRSPMPSPSIQAKRNASLLRNALRRSGYEVKVEPVVVFPNPQVQLWVRKPSVPVLRLDQLLEFLRGREKEAALTVGQINSISQFLLSRAQQELTDID